MGSGESDVNCIRVASSWEVVSLAAARRLRTYQNMVEAIRARAPMEMPTPIPAWAPVEREELVAGVEGEVEEEEEDAEAEVVGAAELDDEAEELLVLVEEDEMSVAVAPRVTARVIARTVPQQSVLFFPQHQV